MSLKRAGAATAAVVVLLICAYGGFLRHRSRHEVSVAPPGPYLVGRGSQEIADRSRTDELSPLGGNPRVLSVWFWYPAAAAGPQSAYAPGAWAGMHRFGWGQTSFSRVRTGTYDDAPFAAGSFPLVVLLPGMGFSAPQYQALAAGLASRGYIVAGVTPTYSANLSVIAGHAVRASAAGDPSDLSGPAGDRLVAVWAADARFAAQQAGVLLGVHVNRNKVAYVGHSFGGAAALEACSGDSACVGAADLDGTPYGAVVQGGLRKPLLLLSSGKDGADQERSAQTLFAASGPAAWAYSITGARHFDFTDYAAYWLAAPVRAVLPLGNPRTLAITGTFLAAFLAEGDSFRPPSMDGVRRADMLDR
ncbi:alpha/beta hydrolase [Paractinoplanes globisporus]|uniref:Alpha/beta hydrolase n=1 Tax=Paractinoplanes globisporus TaxID=113565 RepID=A0ABW6WSS9_9ACTN|nr:alpha/beta hydrolase [Actinoplanes globisporus]